MKSTVGYIQILAVLLMLVQFGLPISGPLYISAMSNNIKDNHSEATCSHSTPDADQKTHDDSRQIPHCHIIDSPFETLSTLTLEYLPIITKISIQEKGKLLPGYGTPKYIPPEIAV